MPFLPALPLIFGGVSALGGAGSLVANKDKITEELSGLLGGQKAEEEDPGAMK